MCHMEDPIALPSIGMALSEIHLGLPKTNEALITNGRLNLKIKWARRRIDKEIVASSVVSSFPVNSTCTIAGNPVRVIDSIGLL